MKVAQNPFFTSQGLFDQVSEPQSYPICFPVKRAIESVLWIFLSIGLAKLVMDTKPKGGKDR